MSAVRLQMHVCGGYQQRMFTWQVIDGANFSDHVARHLAEGSNDPQLCGPVEAEPLDPADIGPGLTLANDTEHALIERLALAVGHRLLLEWDAVPADERVLSMNRAALSALARTLGVFLASVAIVDPSNEAGWTLIVETALEMVRQTATQKRTEAIAATAPAGGLLGADPAQPVFVFPAPETVM